MRILQINTNYLPGGIQRHVLDLSAFLRNRGHRVVLAGDLGDWAPDVNDKDFVHLALDSIAGTGGSLIKRVSEILPVARKLRSALKDNDIQLIHAHETAPLILAQLARMGLDIPIIFTYHGSEIDRITSVARTAKRCADLTISPSRTSLEHLIDKGVARERTKVIGLGVHPLPAPDKSMKSSYRQKLLGENGKYLISSLSRLDPQKGIDIMIEVARKIRDKRDDVVFAVGGHGPLEGMVGHWAEVAGVAEHIRFLGPVSNVQNLLCASDLYLLTSRWEALPISIVEAFQASLPVIATDCGGVKELVTPDVGRVLPVGDTSAIAAAILDLLDDAAQRRKLAEAARALSQHDRFSPPAVHAGFERIYAEMVGVSLHENQQNRIQ